MSSKVGSSSKAGSTTGGQSGKSRGVASSVASGSTGTGSKKTSSQHKRSNSSSSSENSSDDELDAEDSLESQLVPCLASCSRQKMRAIHMALKRMGNNDNRISSKDFYQILTNEYGIKFTPRVVQIIQETFEDNQGIQFEKIFKCMEGAHQRTGRDSVDAALARNDLQTRKTTKTLQEWTEELITRIEEQVSRADVFLDFDDLRRRMDDKDGDKSGLLAKQDLMSFCNEPSFPVYGALLNAVIKHCESEAEPGRIRWSDFVDILERGQTRFTEANPEMRRALTTRPKGGIIKGPGDQAAGAPAGSTKKRATVKMSVEGGDESQAEESSARITNLQPLPTIPSSFPDGNSDAPDAFDSQTVSESSKMNSFPPQRRNTWGHGNNDGDSGDEESWKHLLAPKHHEHHGETLITTEDDQPILQHQILQQEKTTQHHPPHQHQHQNNSKHHLLLRGSLFTTLIKRSNNNNNSLINRGHSKSPSASAPLLGPNHVRLLIDDNAWEETKTDLTGRNLRVLPPTVSHNERPHNQNKPPQAVTVHVISGTNIETQVQVFKPRDITMPVVVMEPDTAVSTTAAKERLQLQWIYGCRANDCRNSLHILANGDLVYFIANIVILYSPNNHTQRFYRAHTDEIKCMNIHPNKRYIVATGQNGYDETVEYKPSKQAVVRVWRGDTLETVVVLGGGMLVRSVSCIAFHPEKDIVAAVDAGSSKYVVLWDFSKGTCLTSCQIKVDLICDMAFNPKMPELLITCGKDHLSWWKINPEVGTFNHLHDANYGYNNPRPKYVICLCHTEKGDLVTGDSNGNIYIWPNGTNTVSNSVKPAHDGSVYSVAIVRNTLVSSGRDGMVYNWQWSSKMERVGELKLLESEGAARVIAVRERHFIFATTTNSILTATLTPGQCPLSLSKLNTVPVTQGHFDALHGLAVPRIGNFFMTAGCDGILLLFDANKSRPLFKYVVPSGGIGQQIGGGNQDSAKSQRFSSKYETFVAADITADARTFALGTKDVALMILSLVNEELVQEFNQKLEDVLKISVIRFSRDGERLAVGTSKGEILVFGKNGTDEAWNMLGICYQPGTLPGSFFTAVTLAVTSVDWTVEPVNECYMFRATFHNTEYAIFNATSFNAVNPPDACDYHWATNTCLLAWDRAGPYEHKTTRETGIRQIDVHPVRRSCLVVSDYTTNKLTLFRYPCTKSDVPGQAYAATLEISSLRFTPLGDYVITVGGKDASILQWKVIH